MEEIQQRSHPEVAGAVMAFRGSGGAPRCVRNFFIELAADGLKKTIRTGPKGRKGGFFLKIFVREEGQVSDSYLIVQGNSNGDINTLTVELHDGKVPVREMSLATTSNAGKMKPSKKEKPEQEIEAAEQPSMMKREKAFWRIRAS